MSRHHSTLLSAVFISVGALAGFASEAGAVIVLSSSQRNLQAPGTLLDRDGTYGPEGSDDPRRLLNSGWQWEGSFQGFLGTPIAPNYFIAARHIGGNVGNVINYHGVDYTTTAVYDDNGSDGLQNSDLRIWKINGTFDSYAPLYNASVDGNEFSNVTQSGKNLVVIGRGTQRGAEVRVNGALKGWQWGASDGAWSWGENTVSSIINNATIGGTRYGSLLTFDFDANGGPNEGALSVGDSSGGVFIQGAGGQWKLAAINFSVDGPFSYDNNGSPGAEFNASIFDAGGLWVGSGASAQFIPDQAADIAGSSYVTRISTRLSWIDSIIGASAASQPVPEPTTGMLGILGSALLARRMRR